MNRNHDKSENSPMSDWDIRDSSWCSSFTSPTVKKQKTSVRDEEREEKTPKGKEMVGTNDR